MLVLYQFQEISWIKLFCDRFLLVKIAYITSSSIMNHSDVGKI